mgnify:CR=1 FL=1
MTIKSISPTRELGNLVDPIYAMDFSNEILLIDFLFLRNGYLSRSNILAAKSSNHLSCS